LLGTFFVEMVVVCIAMEKMPVGEICFVYCCCYFVTFKKAVFLGRKKVGGERLRLLKPMPF